MAMYSFQSAIDGLHSSRGQTLLQSVLSFSRTSQQYFSATFESTVCPRCLAAVQLGCAELE